MIPYQDVDLKTKLIWNLRDIGHILHHSSEGKGSQKRILVVLQRSGSVPQSLLTEHLGIQPGSASEVLAKMEEAGLIRRTVSAEDRRAVLVELTDAGIAAAEQACRERESRKETLFSVLSEEEQRALLVLLEKLNADWSVRFADHARRRLL